MDLYGDGHKIVTDADHIPGRNYLSGTAPVSVQGQNIVGQAITTYALTDKSLSNQVVTFNMTMTSDTTSGRLYVGSNPNWQVYTYYDVQKGINKIQFTTKLNSDVDAIKITIDSSTANLVIQDVTLNKGNFAREYSPAPEDYVMKSDLDDFYNIVPDGAQTHNNVFRGKNLGALTDVHIANIQNGTFKDMFIGDYFAINGSNYVIAGINYKRHHGDNTDLGNHLLLMPSDWSKTPTETLNPNGSTTHFMNDTDTAAGGFANTKLYKTYLPQIQQKLETDFGAHLMNFRTVVSTHVDDSGAPDQGEWRDAKVGIPNEVMIYGTTLNGNNKNNAWYNTGDENSQLPLMRLNDSERCNNRAGAIWLRDIHSSSEFASAGNYGDDSWSGASGPWLGVRTFFLIG